MVKAFWPDRTPSPDWKNMSGVNEIRSTFLNYFKANGHEIVASSPLVPRNATQNAWKH